MPMSPLTWLPIPTLLKTFSSESTESAIRPLLHPLLLVLALNLCSEKFRTELTTKDCPGVSPEFIGDKSDLLQMQLKLWLLFNRQQMYYSMVALKTQILNDPATNKAIIVSLLEGHIT